MIDELVRTLVVAGSPAPSSPELVSRLASQADVVVAADRGADACMRAHVVPAAFVGDADSVSPEALAWVREATADRRLFPPEKDDTDLGLAMAAARELAYERGSYVQTTVTCASGGRVDHAMAVFGVLSRSAADSPILAEDGFECRILSPEGTPTWALPSDAVGSTFSFVALSDGTVVSEVGLRWELDHLRTDALADRGVSNVVMAPDAHITCHAGTLAAFLLV
jgi:thiamine pyrophosphokinase